MDLLYNTGKNTQVGWTNANREAQLGSRPSGTPKLIIVSITLWIEHIVADANEAESLGCIPDESTETHLGHWKRWPFWDK